MLFFMLYWVCLSITAGVAFFVDNKCHAARNRAEMLLAPLLCGLLFPVLIIVCLWEYLEEKPNYRG